VNAVDSLTRLLRWFFRHLYTDLAWTYDLVAWLASAGHWGEWQRTALRALPAGRLLELGHGPGHLLVELSRQGRDVLGIDPSPQMSHQAARRLRHAGHAPRLVRARAAELPFASEAFAGVLSTFPSEYILEAQAIASIARVMRSGGTLVIVPVVQVIGRDPFSRILSLAYRVLGEGASGAPKSAGELLGSAFSAVETESVECTNALVVRVTARKRAA